MWAIRFHGVGDLRVEDVPVPAPAEGEVLLRPVAAGVCGTDVHILDGHYAATTPVTLGHEVAGEVVEVGHGVADVEVGELVTVQPNLACGHCAYCRLGQEHMCLYREAYGVERDGGMAQLMRVPAKLVYGLPPGTPHQAAALAEPLSCCLHGMDRLAPRSGRPLLVMGCGPAGALLIALARLAGARPVVAADTRADRRDLAERFGADVVLDPRDEKFAEQALAETAGLGYPAAIDAVGSPVVLESCVRLASRAASVLVFGVAAPEAEARVRPQEIYAKELTILGSAVNPYTMARAVGLLGRLPLDRLRIATYPLEEAAAAIEAARGGDADKVMITP